MSNSEIVIIKKTWSTLQDDAIVREVATKGQHILACIQFLGKRRNETLEISRQYFHDEVNVYIKRLLTNRQFFKAATVLTNVQRNPPPVFYEFSALSGDKSLIDNTLEHIHKIYDGFNQDEYCFNWNFVKLMRSNPIACSRMKLKLNPVTLEQFYKLDVHERKQIVVEFAFEGRIQQVVDRMDKRCAWSYLLKSLRENILNLWLEVLLEKAGINNAEEEEDLSEEFDKALDFGNENHKQFDKHIARIFRSWDLEASMITQLNDCALSEITLNNLAKLGFILKADRDEPLKFLRRIFTNQQFDHFQDEINSEAFKRSITEVVLQNNFVSLLTLPFLSDFVLDDERYEATGRYSREIELALAIKQSNLAEINGLVKISTEISEYLLEKDVKFYSKNPMVFFLERTLQKNDLSAFTTPENRDIVRKMPFLHKFLTKMQSNSSINDTDLTPIALLRQFHKLNLSAIQLEAGDEPIAFTNKKLQQKYAHHFTLNYRHYLKQKRSSFAVISFISEQLQQFSQISRGQTAIAVRYAGDLAIRHWRDSELVAHCVAFIETLNADASILRAYLVCMQMLGYTNDDDIPCGDLLVHEVYMKMDLRVPPNIRQFEALATLARYYKINIPDGHLNHFARANDWFNFILFASYFKIPVQQVVTAAQSCFQSRIVAENIARAIKYEVNKLDYRRKVSVQQKQRMSGESNNSIGSSSVSSSEVFCLNSNAALARFLDPNVDDDLFAIILLSFCDEYNNNKVELSFEDFKELWTLPELQQNHTSLNLLRHSLRLQWPFLAILASTVSPDLCEYSWVSWLIAAVHFPQNDEYGSLQDLAQDVISFAVKNQCTLELNKSFQIFYPDTPFTFFTEFLWRTNSLNFDTTCNDDYLTKFLARLNDDESNCHVKFLPEHTDILNFVVQLIVLHLKHNFNSLWHQKYFLIDVCASGINDYIQMINFNVLKRLCDIVAFTDVQLHFERFLRTAENSDDAIRVEFERISTKLVKSRHFENALRLATLLCQPKEKILVEHWASIFEQTGCIDFNACEQMILKEVHPNHTLPASTVVELYSKCASKCFYSEFRYNAWKRCFHIGRKYKLEPPNYDADMIELEMTQSLLKTATLDIQTVEIFHSEYHEAVMVNDRFVLYETFDELMRIAGVNDLTILNNKTLSEEELERLDALIYRLLNDYDIVQALRIQAIFNRRPLEFRQLVFCMALAEGINTLTNMTSEERQLLNEGSKTALAKFNNKMLRTRRFSQTSSNSSPSRTTDASMDHIQSICNLDFEEIPSRDKQETLEALQIFASRLSHGVKFGQRIAMMYRVAIYVDRSYSELLTTRDPYALLGLATSEECLNKLLVISDVIQSVALSHTEIAEFFTNEIAKVIIRSRLHLMQSCESLALGLNTMWGFDLDKDFHLILNICPDTSLLGVGLLNYCDALKVYRKTESGQDDMLMDEELKKRPELVKNFNNLKTLLNNQVLSHKRQNTIIVEILIKAHDCFVYECSMEGIVRVMQRAKALNQVLASAKSWSLIVRMLTGLGRYREMYYCFETLIKNAQFESLLGQFDEKCSGNLKQGVVAYLKENYPDNQEYYRLAAVHFGMYKELAEMWHREAKSIISNLTSECTVSEEDSNKNLNVLYLKFSPDIVPTLKRAVDTFVDATENLLLDNRLNVAQKVAAEAELTVLQLELVRRALDEGADICFSVLNIQSEGVFKNLVLKELTVSQALALNACYPYDINWSEVLYFRFVVLNDEAYLNDYSDMVHLTEQMIEALIKHFQQETAIITERMEQNVKRLIELLQSVTLRYKLASLLGFKSISESILFDESGYYLKDTNYGRDEIL